MKKNNHFLSDNVSISVQYQRSIRLDTDFGKYDPLQGFICHETASKAVENMALQIVNTNQRAFTWTGPYGSGKSSLALAISSVVCTSESIRSSARKKFPPKLLEVIDRAFPIHDGGWVVLPVVGKRSGFKNEIITSINKLLEGEDIEYSISEADLVQHLVRISRRFDGLLLVIDEMGKFLENAAIEGDDIYFFQDLAESAAREDSNLLTLGILHQSFRQYADKLQKNVKDEWSKIQGRFSDIPIIVNSDEIVDLVGNAITRKYEPAYNNIFKKVSDIVKNNRPALDSDFSEKLKKCWPLHPVMAMLLGPISKKQFGQNERSTFTFLSSGEPNGFQVFLKNSYFDNSISYKPCYYWDYIRANFEVSVHSSTEGHRWAQAVESVERAESRVSNAEDIRVSIVKTIAILNLFRNGTGLVASDEVLHTIYPNILEIDLSDALQDLSLWRVVVFRKYLGAWAIFEGSDFNIDTAIKEVNSGLEVTDTKILSRLAGLHPIIAKRHYYETGSLRWMDISLQHYSELNIKKGLKHNGAFGEFIILLSEENILELDSKVTSLLLDERKDFDFILGVPQNSSIILSLGKELIALNIVKENLGGLLEGDSVARREVDARLDAIKIRIEEELKKTIASAKWFVNGKWSNDVNIHVLASRLAEFRFHNTPIIRSEIMNRNKLSSSAAKARRELMHKMINNERFENLGLEGYPAERGVYEIVLKKTNLHKKNIENNWSFLPPGGNGKCRLHTLWVETDKLFSIGMVNVGDIYAMWGTAPYGIHDGIKPIIFLAYMLSRRDILSVYKSEMFLPEFGDVEVDELLQNERNFKLRKVVIGLDEKVFLDSIATVIKKLTGRILVEHSPLEAAKGLVKIIFMLPSWTLHTNSVSESSKTVRDLLYKASDPYKILFVDLKEALCQDEEYNEYSRRLERAILELISAYPNMLEKFKIHVQSEIGTACDIHQRCNYVRKHNDDLRFSAFIDRLDGLFSQDFNVENTISLALNKPIENWRDGDIKEAKLIVSEWATKFKHIEAYAVADDRESKRNVVAVVIGSGKNTNTRICEFDILEHERLAALSVVEKFFYDCEHNGLSPKALLGAIAERGIDFAQGGDE
ncbi:ATP-binding protein [Pectobacterium carotovorum]|uniref:ATP-binding protein n=1 Tax=Pectobacterium carotovorum TaxID=554 RepID=UPI00301B59F0